MLKKRIIPVQLIYNNRLVKTKKFNDFRDVGNPIKSSHVYSNQDADELIILNIDRNDRSISGVLKILEKINENCFMPITVGGGIKSLKDAEKLFNYGADKISLNTASFYDKNLIEKIVEIWGSQALTISIDVFKEVSGKYSLKSNCGQHYEKVSLKEHIKQMIDIGIGEIFCNSINNDGMMQGYDIELVKTLSSISSVPVIICGGAGNFYHLKDVLEQNISAVGCGSLFNFGDNNPMRAKAFLKNYNIPLKVI